VSGRVVETEVVFDRLQAAELSAAYRILVPERPSRSVRVGQEASCADEQCRDLRPGLLGAAEGAANDLLSDRGDVVAGKPSSATDDLADYFHRHGNYFTDGQTVETTRTMGTGTQTRQRRVVYNYSFKRSQHDNRAIKRMIERAGRRRHPAIEKGPVRHDHREASRAWTGIRSSGHAICPG
jgi:hypothetical protein